MKVNPIEPKGQKIITFTGYPYTQRNDLILHGHFPEHHSVENLDPQSKELSVESLLALSHLQHPILPDGTGILLDILA